MRGRQFSLSPPLYKFAFAMLLVGLAFALTYTEAANTFSSYDVKAILALGAAVNAPLLAGALLLLRRSKLIANTILSLVVLASGTTAYIIHTDLFAAENRLGLIMVGVAALFVLFVAFRVIDQQRWGGVTLLVVALLGLGAVLGPHFLERHGPLEVKTVLVLGAAVNVPLLIGLPFLLRRSKLIANAILSLVVLASGTTVAYIIHTGLYAAENQINLVTVGVAALFVLFVAFRAIDQQRWGGGTLSAAALIGLGTVLGGHFLEGRDPATPTTPVEVDMSNIQHVSFHEKPNIYFISFESLVPRSLLRKHYGLENSPFHDLFETNFRRFPNFFSDSDDTRESLNMILALDKEMFSKSPPKYRHNLFPGVQPSPLLGILRNSGYETTTSYFYHSTYLGRHKGPYIDHYIRGDNAGICGLLDTVIRPISFWGYCAFVGEASWRSLDEHFESLTANERPQFLMAHIGVPGHTDSSFRYYDQVQRNIAIRRYAQSLDGAATRQLEVLLEHLRNHDPAAILYVYGDHGPRLSQGISFEDNPTFVVQDRLGVLGGVYPPGACATYFDETLSKGYMTTLEGVHAILRCLSGGESALRTPRELAIRAHHHVLRGITLSYKEFLYE